VRSERSVLDVDEVIELVQLLLDVGQSGVADLGNFSVNLAFPLLEYLDFAIDTGALFLAMAREDVDALLPGKTDEAGKDTSIAIKLLEMLCEKVAFVLLDEVLDAVVIADNHHDVFPQFAEGFTLGKEADDGDIHVDHSQALDLVPNSDFVDHFQKVDVEVTAKSDFRCSRLLNFSLSALLLWRLFIGLFSDFEPSEDGDS